MILENSIGVAGYFQITKIDRNGNLVEYPEQKNLILDNLINGILRKSQTLVNGGSYNSNPTITISDLGIGTGSVVPQATDIKLNQFSAYSSRYENIISNSDLKEPGVARITRAYKFYFNGLNQANYTEVGLYNVNSSGSGERGILYTRSLIKGPDGEPTSITVLPGEILEITYRLEYLYDVNPKTSTIELTKKASDKSITQETLEYKSQLTIPQNHNPVLLSPDYLGEYHPIITSAYWKAEIPDLSSITIPWNTSGVWNAVPGQAEYSGNFQSASNIGDLSSNGMVVTARNENNTNIYEFKTGTKAHVFEKGIGLFRISLGYSHSIVVYLKNPIMKTNTQTWSLGVKFTVTRI